MTTAALDGAVLVTGTSSGAGKSTVVAGLCRLLARRGVSVAPFKAQNMSNHSAVTADGGEVGRAQAMQASAAGIDVTAAMNPILLKPSANARSHVVVGGTQTGTTDARRWGVEAAALRTHVLDAYRSLRSDYDVVVAEGAGGAAEINLFDRDVVNLPLAAAAGMRSVLVVDIDRGGAFASAYGTIALLPDPLRDTVAGIIFNRFRGDASLLKPGIAELEARTGIPVLGVLPHLGREPMLGVEDSLDIGTTSGPGRYGSPNPLRIAVIRLPHLANPSDFDPLVVEDDVALRWATSPGELTDTDVIVLPGSRATVADLAWLRDRGLDEAISVAYTTGRADILGICAGAQMLGTTIIDGVESTEAAVDGLGLLPTETRFDQAKVVERRTGVADGIRIAGYQIHHGRTSGGQAWLHLDATTEGNGRGLTPTVTAEGAISPDGRLRATSLHGIFDNDWWRRAWLVEAADRQCRMVTPSPMPFTDRIAAQHDRLADWLIDNLAIDMIGAIIGEAAAAGTEPGW